jgi:hypothetical protein
MKIKNILSLIPLILLLLKCASQNSNSLAGKNKTLKVTNYEVIFPMNGYLTTDGTTPYPVVAQKKIQNIDTRSFINVMDYGALGNGSHVDDAAIAKAFAACKNGGGVLFPKGKIFLIQNLIHIPLNKNITVKAYGATFKMASNTGYNAIAFEGEKTGYDHWVIWLGGTFDGNKDNQAWPGSPTKNNNWAVTQSNYGLLTIRRAKFALVKDILLTNTVYDGVNLFECELGVIADSKANNGVEFNYGHWRYRFDTGHQATYFKCTRRNSQVVYFINLDCKGGSIGVQYSTNKVSDSSLAVVSNCRFYNQAQDALHFESCRKVFINQSIVGADNSAEYHADVHISNSCEIASIKNSQFNNGRIDFRNASKLQLGIVEDCQFKSYAQNKNDSLTLRAFIKNATHVEDCTFKGRTKEEQVTARYVTKSSFENFDIAVNARALIYKCKFDNGNVAVKNPRKPLIKECVFKNTSSAVPSNVASNENSLTETTLKNLLTKSIRVIDERKKFLGYIVQ